MPPSKRPSILVVGSANMDLVAEMERAPVPGESFFGSRYQFIPGGKGANQAVAAARLGADVTFVGRVGRDANGAVLRAQLESEGISTEFLKEDPGAPTGLAVILVEANGQNRIIVYPGANMRMRKEDLAPALARPCDAVMLQLEIADEMIVETVRAARERGIPVVLDAAPARGFDLRRTAGVDILSPNETEAASFAGAPCSTVEEASRAAAVLAERAQAAHVVIKLGANGALWFHEGRARHFPAYKVQALDPTAAGDAFTAAMTIAWLRGRDLAEAIPYGAAAGALAATRLGAQPSLPTAQEVEQFLRR